MMRDASAAPPRGLAVSTADWLGLAAAPAFAAMALATGVFCGGKPAPLCAAGPDASALVGMAPMYLLMCAVHLGPWLRRLGPPRASP